MSLPPPGAPGRQRILVVCYGNICRSPVAEALLRGRLRAHGLDRGYVVRSAGVGALPGAPAARGMQEVAREHGLDLGIHRARRMTADMAHEADVLIALDEVVEEEIGIQAGEVPVVLWPVDDPYGGPPDGYRRAFAEIAAHVDRFVGELRERSARGERAC